MKINDDIGHKLTDKILDQLEKDLLKVYEECYSDTKKKIKRVETILSEYKDTATEKERIRLWRKKERLETLLKGIEEDILEVNEVATKMINNEMLNVYATNSNYANYFMEVEGGYELNFKLYNQETIKQLLIDKESNFTKIALRKLEDGKRIRKELSNQFAQAIRSGESIQEISKRVRKVVDRNMNDSLRIARTETTRIESVGREEMFKKGESMGLKLKKQWISTTDKRTRESHLLLNLESVGMDEKFSNGLKYPGDMNGRAEEVCNCRCSHIVQISGIEKSSNLKKLDEELRKKNYQEWLERRY